MAKKQTGRPTPLDRGLVKRIIERIQGGFYQKHAIDSLGYSERVLHKWKSRGEEEIRRMEQTGATRPRKGEEPYVHLAREMRKAQAEVIIRHATNIQQNALGQDAKYMKDKDGNVKLDDKGRQILLQPPIPPSWPASARYLEAVDHNRWGRKVRQEITVPDDEGPSELRITVIDKRKLKKRKKVVDDDE